MPGLLSKGGFDDPLTMGLLGASQALMTPMSQGGGMGAAFNAFPAAQQQAMRQQFLRQQMEGQQSEAELRRAQLIAAQEEARRKIELDSRRQDLFGRIGMQPLTQALAAEAAALGIKPAELADIANAGRAKVARTFEVMGPNNLPQTRQVDDYGNQVGADFAKPVEMRMADLGGSLSPYNPFAPPSSLTKTMAPGERERLDLTVRGQNMADARSRESTAATLASGIAGRAPAGFRFKPDGTLEFIPGGPADPKTKTGKPTEDENKSAGYAIRMEDALKTMAAVTKEKPSAATPNLLAKGVGAVSADLGNLLTPEARQRVEAAQLDALDAALTLATGAAYTKEQLAGLSKSYFPQLYDEPKTIADKQARFAKVIETARIRAGTAAGNIDLMSNRPAGLGSGQVSGQVGGGRPPLSSFGAP